MGQLASPIVVRFAQLLGALSIVLPAAVMLDGSASPGLAQGPSEAAIVTPTRMPRSLVASRTWAPHVSASYKIAFNGFDVGRFTFQSSIKGSKYSLEGQAELSAFLGAFRWNGVTRTSGTLSGDRPKPSGYAFEFSGTGRSGFVKMGFNGNSVASFNVFPLMPPAPGNVPLKEVHLQSVLDPLSAVIALARGNLDRPCGRRLSIFDGRQRFELTLTHKETQRLTEVRSSGQPDIVHVCRVRYVPIAGYVPSEEVKAMTRADIEISLRPVPSANLLVPHQIIVPTAAGTATLTSERIDITTPARTQIALIN